MNKRTIAGARLRAPALLQRLRAGARLIEVVRWFVRVYPSIMSYWINLTSNAFIYYNWNVIFFWH